VKKRKIIFIINPKSGVSKKNNLPKLISQSIDSRLFDYQITYTEKPGHGTEIAKKALIENFEAVIAVGGDGSINEIGKILVNTNVSLGIIPSGSGNGIARSLHLPLKVTDALSTINNFKVKTIDTGSIHEEIFIGIAGIGFDAHIGHLFMSATQRGFANYIKLIFKEFWNFKNNHLELKVDGKEVFKGTFFTAVAANTRQYGNNAFIAPLAKEDDQWLEFTIIKKFHFYSVPKIIYQLFNKTLHQSKHVITTKGKTGEFKTNSVYFHKDGEAQLVKGDLLVKIKPLSLQVIV
jgi:diacylglycerol kinase (ATP)